MAEITVNGENKIQCREGDVLFNVLSEGGYTFTGNCGGRGVCRRCLVYDELAREYIRSCMHKVGGDMHIRVLANETDILTSYDARELSGKRNAVSEYDVARPYGVAVDLGTTTVAMELVDLRTGETPAGFSFLNPQIAYGSDVISRIKVGSDAEGLARLRGCITAKLSEGIHDMLCKCFDGMAHTGCLSRVVISGNTTMLAILEGLLLDNLGHAPFEIKNRDVLHADGALFFGDSGYAGVDVICLMNLSAFVGADALCGALGCMNAARSGGDGTGAYELFADLGTNGELILANGSCGYATSCACGPAFEGMLKRANVNGSNAFDMINMLKAMHKISDEGVLSDEYLEKGYVMSNGVTIDMDMIRSFLLAKAAICAGTEALMLHAGIGEEDVEMVHIAGGFGCCLNMRNAASLGLFPESFEGKAKFEGNTSLLGAHLALTDNSYIDKLYAFRNTLTPVNLAELQGFDRLYYSRMNLRRVKFTAEFEIADSNIKQD